MDQADWDAFQGGYGAELTSDPVLRFFFARQLISTWLPLAGAGTPLAPEAAALANALVRIVAALQAEEQG